MIIRYLRLCQLSKVHYWPSKHTDKKTVIKNAFFIDWRTVLPPQWIYLWGSNGRCLLFFILPDECLFQRNEKGNEGYMMENDEIRAKPKRTTEDLMACRPTGTIAWDHALSLLSLYVSQKSKKKKQKKKDAWSQVTGTSSWYASSDHRSIVKSPPPPQKGELYRFKSAIDTLLRVPISSPEAVLLPRQADPKFKDSRGSRFLR